MGQAIFQGEAYLHSLRESLKQIKTDEAQLGVEASKSHDWNLYKQLDAVQQELSILRSDTRNTIIVFLDAHVAERCVSKTSRGKYFLAEGARAFVTVVILELTPINSCRTSTWRKEAYRPRSGLRTFRSLQNFYTRADYLMYSPGPG